MAERKIETGIENLKERLWHAKYVAVLTGAGISAESGVPTFRGEGGLWKKFRAVDLATPEAFSRDPKLVWEFYNWRRELIGPLSPNPGHFALVEIERRVPKFTLITQNIDGLHKKAGSINIIELHGNLWKLRCTRCETVSEDPTGYLSPKCRNVKLAAPFCGHTWSGSARCWSHVCWMRPMRQSPVAI